MKKTALTLFLVLSTIFSLAHAEPYTGEDVGLWFLKKIIPIRVTKEKPLLKIGHELEELNNRLELYGPNKNDLTYCELGVDSDGEATPTEKLAGFIAAVGGKDKLDQLLRENTGVPLEKIRRYWGMQVIQGSKPPCSNIWKDDSHLAEKSFYFTNDKKKFFLFISPYIYYFSGGWGPITGGQ